MTSITTFAQANAALLAQLQDCRSWNSFASSLMGQYEHKGTLSVNQVEAAQRMFSKMAVSLAKVEANKGAVDMSALHSMFDVAKGNGLKNPRFLVGDIEIRLAKPGSANAGGLYIFAERSYAGKVIHNTYYPKATAPDDTLEILRETAMSPFDAAKRYGYDTGRCSCCGKELTDPKSIAMGIGPVCAKNWGFV